MDFIFGDAVILGVCTSISESGLRGKLSANATPGTEGQLTLYRDSKSVQVSALIDSYPGQEVCIRFQPASDAELLALREFLKLLRPAAS